MSSRSGPVELAYAAATAHAVGCWLLPPVALVRRAGGGGGSRVRGGRHAVVKRKAEGWTAKC